MHGEPALPADFDHLPYANPDAPKGGRITYGFVGTFDSLNPFIVKGTSPRGLWDETLGRNVWESLLTRNRDEPFSLYGLLAESVDVPDDRSWVEFTLRPEAKFADGEPVKPEDVIFTVELLQEKGRPPTRPMLSQRGRQGREDRRAQRALHFQGRRQPRAAAADRPDGHSAQARDRPGDLRPDARSPRRSAPDPTPSPKSMPGEACS